MNRRYGNVGLAALVAFVLGAGAMWVYQNLRRPDDLQTDMFLDNVFDDRFFSQSRDPFQEMARIRRPMDEMFA